MFGSAALALAATGEPVLSLENSFLRFEVGADKEKLASRRFTNRLSKQTVTLPASDFELEFQDGAVLNSANCSLQASAKGNLIGLLYTGRDFQVRVQYELPAGKAYLRKRMSVRARGTGERRLLRIDLENWQGVRRPWTSVARVAGDVSASHPVYCDDLWAGVEFVAAFNIYNEEGFMLRSRPGGKRVGTDWVPLRSTVVGVAEPGNVRNAFYTYMDDIRLVSPPRYVTCYNSWWSLPRRFQSARYLALIRDVKEKFYDRQGIFFDLVATDAGWNDKRSIWEIDRHVLPDGFTPARTIVESAGGKLGLWMSPSETYKENIDYEWARQSGYAVAGGGAGRGSLSLADLKYREQTIRQIQKLIVEYGLEHVKFDGLAGREAQGHHDMLPGDDSVEPLAEYALALVDSAKQANPRLVTEPTYASSPWLIAHSDTVWGPVGDCPAGMGPAPDFRESHTNSREFRIFRSIDQQVWLPQHAVQYFDIVHCDPDDGFPNHAAMAFGRGRFFIPCYINPKFMRDEDWTVLAGLIRWGRKNQDILYHTVVLPSRVELGEPYAYAHWLGSRGIIAVRNPSNQNQSYVLDFHKAGAPTSLKDAVAYTQYPYRKGIAARLDGSSALRLDMEPWELLFVEVQNRAQLQEPVVIGARWRRDQQGRVLVIGEHSAKTAWLIQPQGGEREIPLQADAEEPKVRIVEHTVKKTDAGLAFQVEYEITSPLKALTRVLLLLEFPGRRFFFSECRATINGSNVDSWSLNRRTSLDRIGEFSGPYPNGLNANRPNPNAPSADTAPPDSHWTWYIVEAGPGVSRVRFFGQSEFSETRLRAWAWTDWDLSQNGSAIEVACPVPEMPQYRAEVERRGIRIE